MTEHAGKDKAGREDAGSHRAVRTPPGSTFEDAALEDASHFARCRELVVEILRREIAGDPERARAVGAVAVVRTWCYAEWAELLRDTPHLQQIAAEIFARYPRSGMHAALALAARRHPVGISGRGDAPGPPWMEET